MPAKKNSTAGVEEEAPAKVSANPLEEKHAKLRDDRRALEAELSIIDEQIRAAINNGDLESLDKLASRKAELPRLFIAASTAEMGARQILFGTEDKSNLARLRAAEDSRDELQTAFIKMRIRHEEEAATLTAELQDAIVEVGAAYSAIQSSRDLSAANDAGFKRAMATLTGV
jgi:hypothetical protein